MTKMMISLWLSCFTGFKLQMQLRFRLLFHHLRLLSFPQTKQIDLVDLILIRFVQRHEHLCLCFNCLCHR